MSFRAIVRRGRADNLSDLLLVYVFALTEGDYRYAVKNVNILINTNLFK